ncbi:MAG: hypothetical protein PUP90_11130 [Nostoc sp. S4]|nr:hypothetical protein [Nostoc sp. S4]
MITDALATRIIITNGLAIFLTSETPRLTRREDFDEKERSPPAQR